MVKAYLRYEPKTTFGLITSPQGPSLYSGDGSQVLAPALEDVLLWDVRKGALEGRWKDTGNTAEITGMARSPDSKVFAIGYADGAIRLWLAEEGDVAVTLNGHRGAVTAMTFDPTGQYLASGSTDTNVIVWDIVEQVGLYRLKGHKDVVTGLAFLPHNHLVSLTKDTLLKLWDLQTQHCRETILSHRSEAWSLTPTPDRRGFITVGSDQEMKIWGLDEAGLRQGVAIGQGEVAKVITPLGHVDRASKERASSVQFHPSGKFIACQSAGKSLEIFRVRSAEEVKKKQARRAKRRREKQRKTPSGPEVEEEEGEDGKEISMTDCIGAYKIIRTTAKIRSFDFKPVLDEEDQLVKGGFDVMLSLSNNSLEVWKVSGPSKDKAVGTPEPERLHVLDAQGHRSDIRCVALSQDNELLVSASHGLLKVWNVSTGVCIRSMECGHALSCIFFPGDRQVAVGTKAGTVEIFDLGSSSLVETVDAHTGSVWSMQVRPDQKGLITGSADKDVKFWDFDLTTTTSEGGSSKARRLTLVHMRTLRMSDDVLCVRYSPNQQLVAVSLLDATVKVFHHDTLKFFLSLYGHKLPVLSMDISSDSSLIVTSSADKNVKIWGLDFGDCHKSIFAHQESIMAVHFLPGTHYFFTAGKDRMVKYWDGDHFEMIQKLPGHHGEVWALAVGKTGGRVVSCSQDRSIRVWERTEEQLFLEEEREQELEELYESNLASELDRTHLAGKGIGAGDEDEEEMGEGATAGKKTVETLKAGERILEAIDLADEEREAWRAYREMEVKMPGAAAPPNPHVLLAHMGNNVTPEQYVLKVVEKVKLSELEEALLVIPFDKAISLLGYLDLWAVRGWNVTLTSRILVFLLKTYHRQIVSNRMMRPLLDSIRGRLRTSLQRQKDMMGFNLAGLTHMRRDIEAKSTAEFFDEDAIQQAKDDQTKKRKFVTV
ncbi:WD40-repeat-containing domain protein [Piptocephalis cylindrospora]|uniref:WD40-repeat-containing domain protein n=1 Tax=Piptocephalis cylindrospora TaxID=1907219 RepID=A0A4V1IXZ7_9FUNG|nr:WD40-repeat-containing domain protein [Piptocephalis cylindrospora]|eukprot:RKP12799.1 WD40-repeat-containing domain protein [Piptocephalis cylindrospora]